MASFLVDTNHLSPLVTINHPLRQRFLNRKITGDKFFIIYPILTEVLFGLHMTPRSQANLEEWRRLSIGIGIIDVELDDAEFAAQLQATLRRSGRQLGTIDAFAATIALRQNLVLLTTDKDFEPILGLNCENWFSALPS